VEPAEPRHLTWRNKSVLRGSYQSGGLDSRVRLDEFVAQSRATELVD